MVTVPEKKTGSTSLPGDVLRGFGASSSVGLSASFSPFGTISGIPPKSNDETTGDLYRRQGDDKKAIAAYEKALRQSFPSASGFYNRITFPPGQPSPKNRRLMQKLSQAQIGAGDFDKARQLLDNLSRAEAASSKAHEKGSLPFSAQLVVSVKKADLDAVAAGKIKAEEFKKRATVRYFQ